MVELTQTDPFEIKGEWWRPDGAELVRALEEEPERESYGLDEGFARLQRPRDRLEGSDLEHACRGPLTFEPESGLRLNLLGSSEAVFPQRDSGYAVHGLTANGVPCSLLDCFVTNTTRQLFGGFADRVVLGNSFVYGVHIDSLADLVLDRLTIWIPGLLEFVSVGGGLGKDDPEDREVDLGEAKITFQAGEKRSRTARALTRERVAVVEIELEESISYEEWLGRWVEPLVRLITFATMRPTVAEAVRISVDVFDGESERSQRIQVVQPQRRLGGRRDVRIERMLVSLGWLGDRLERFLTGWWELHDRLGGVSDFLFGALRDPMSLEPQLTTLASVTEGYHRAAHENLVLTDAEHEQLVERILAPLSEAETARHYKARLSHGNEPMQKDRFLDVFGRAGEVVQPLGHRRGRLAEVIGATRNYFVHLGTRPELVLEGMELYEVNQLLLLALQCNLLLDLGLSHEQVASAVERAHQGQPYWRELHQRQCAWPRLPATK